MLADAICNEGSACVSIMKLRPTPSIASNDEVYGNDMDLSLRGFICRS